MQKISPHTDPIHDRRKAKAVLSIMYDLKIFPESCIPQINCLSLQKELLTILLVFVNNMCYLLLVDVSQTDIFSKQ